ncbi:MAG TPA: dihydropteroate synthase [Bacteroidia bacterium]|nr:dihydropteroate synthase [Bacteroidia bacterium]
MPTIEKAIKDFYPAPLKLSKGRTLDFNSTRVMGVVNITPDSFYDGGKYATTELAIKQAEKLIAEGADILDLGACSTRPNAIDIGAKEEMKRLLPVLDNLVKNHPDVIISVDTYRAEVAKEAVERGAAIVNDISGGTMDDKMFEVVGKLNVPYILMHIQGTPETMQVEPHYVNVVEEVEQFFVERIKKLQDAGVKQIVIDPGFGFGKNVEHNYTLLQNLHKFTRLGLPIMAGLSRKSMINKVLHTKPENALTGTTVLNTLAILEGANILRVHDVKETLQVIKLVQQFQHPKTA